MKKKYIKDCKYCEIVKSNKSVNNKQKKKL